MFTWMMPRSMQRLSTRGGRESVEGGVSDGRPVSPITHGATGAPVQIEATDHDGTLRLAVTNQGPLIPEEVRPSLFQPFSRGGTRGSLQGLELGLYIAAEIAKAHKGQIDLTSDDACGTTFTLTLPTRHE